MTLDLHSFLYTHVQCMYMFTLAELGLDPFTLYVFMLISVECPIVHVYVKLPEYQ